MSVIVLNDIINDIHLCILKQIKDTVFQNSANFGKLPFDTTHEAKIYNNNKIIIKELITGTLGELTLVQFHFISCVYCEFLLNRS